VYAGIAWLFVGTILYQVFLAGRALIQLGGTGDFQPHMEFGWSWVGLAALALVISSAVARPGWRQVLLALLVFVLYIVQISLPGMKTENPIFSALHPVNALILFGLALAVARRATALARTTPASEPTQP
jgi:uncharacterized membrane protein YccF (DUF307 family)